MTWREDHFRGLYRRRGKCWFEAKASVVSRLRYVLDYAHRGRMEWAAMLNDGTVSRDWWREPDDA